MPLLPPQTLHHSHLLTIPYMDFSILLHACSSSYQITPFSCINTSCTPSLFRFLICSQCCPSVVPVFCRLLCSPYSICWFSSLRKPFTLFTSSIHYPCSYSLLFIKCFIVVFIALNPLLSWVHSHCWVNSPKRPALQPGLRSQSVIVLHPNNTQEGCVHFVFFMVMICE